MAKQAISRADVIPDLSKHPVFKPAKPLTEYRTPELRRRYNAFKKAEQEGREISLKEARRGKAMTPERPGAITKLAKKGKRAEQYATGSKQKPPSLDDMNRLHKRSGENHYGEVTIPVHGLVLYEHPGWDECREEWEAFTIQWRLAQQYLEESEDIYEFVYKLSFEKHIRWCEIWSVQMLPAHVKSEKKSA